MRLALVALIALAAPAAAYRFDPGAGVGRYQPADCSVLHETAPAVPLWSRLSWSAGFGVDSIGEHATVALTAQASAALWLRERRCTPDAGGWFFKPNRPWLRWSLALSGDAMWRFEPADDIAPRQMREPHAEVPILRPALRISRARLNHPLWTGSVWTPDSEWFATLGPTYEHGWGGAGASIGYRVSVLAVELRINAMGEHGTEGFLMWSLVDLHGLAPLGRARD